MKRIFVAIALLLTFATPVLVTQSSYAFDPLGDVCKTKGASQSNTCSTRSSKDPINGPDGILKKVSLVLASIAGVVAVIMIIVAGMQYVLSGGDTQKTARARGMIVGAVVGLVVIVSAESILLFVLSKL